MSQLDEEYTQLLQSLLPPGPAWDKEDPLIKGLAPSLAQAHQHADSLMIEINPAQSVELINRYEKLCGLPDKCLANRQQTTGERQQVLDAKVNTVGGISEAFFKKQLEILGYPTATIEQFQHLDSTPDPSWGDKWRYYWRVNIPAQANVRWMTCISDCPSPIRTWGDSAVECVIRRQCPSHTHVIFAYPEGARDASH
ncbi:YmfQ family protein [Symbiopectobacterium sp. RP]|uniref:YmfQ family protein n=1 Tax=Symbiopectobacterium sp. RP TaxID=3248553 RepID=UPI003D27644F